MLSQRNQYFVRLGFYKLTLMHAFVDAGRCTEIGRIATRIEIEFTKACPRFAVVGRNSGVNGVAVGKHIVPNAIGIVYFGKRRGVRPEEKQATVF